MRYSNYHVFTEDVRVKVVWKNDFVTLECFAWKNPAGKVKIPIGMDVPEKVRNSVIHQMNMIEKKLRIK